MAKAGMRSIYVRPRAVASLERAIELHAAEDAGGQSISRTIEVAVGEYVAKREAAAAAAATGAARREAYARDFETAYQAAYARGRGSLAGVYRYVHEETGRATIEAPPEGEDGWREYTAEEMDEQDESVTDFTCLEAAKWAARAMERVRRGDNVTDEELADEGWTPTADGYEFTGRYTPRAVAARQRLDERREHEKQIAGW